MGNQAVITTRERKFGLYLHWNGGRDTVGPLLRYCELQGYCPPSEDDYGWARLCQVIGNFFGGSLSLGLGRYTTDRRMDPGDNGIYVIEGWKIVDRIHKSAGCEEQLVYDFDEMLRAFDEAMPERLRLGGFLDSVEVPVGEVKLGDEVWLRDGASEKWEAFPVVGFGQPDGDRIPVWVDMSDGRRKVTYPDMPYVAWYDHDGDFSWNPNNYVRGDTARIKSRG